MLEAAWLMVMPVSDKARSWMIFLSVILCAQVSIQDFRDVEGDLKVGRQTFPVVCGDDLARNLVTAIFVAVFVAITVMFDPISFPARWAIVGIINTTGGLIVARLLLFRSKKADDRTYRFYVWWNVMLLLFTVVPLSEA